MTREEFVKTFQKRLFEQFPDGYQHWWPRFIFHFSDITNIISVLNHGKLYSRQKAKELSLMQNDNADDSVMRNTKNWYKHYVRCYFGAKTPTQYNNEGIKPQHRIKDNAHCPVPVFLLFDFVKLLSRSDVKFSGGNVAARSADVYDDIEHLNDLEFHHIYNRETLPETGKGHINYCRQAEVLVPNELDVYDYLKWVCVRSKADKDTLLYGLNDTAKERLSGKIRIFTGDGLFEKKELYITDVELKKDRIVMHFANPSKEIFDIELKARDNLSGKEYTYKNSVAIDNHKIYWKIDEDSDSTPIYDFMIRVDGHKVYNNLLIDLDVLPF